MRSCGYFQSGNICGKNRGDHGAKYTTGGNQKWQVVDGLIKHESGYCIELDTDKVGIFMQECDKNKLRQLWKWKKREDKKSNL